MRHASRTPRCGPGGGDFNEIGPRWAPRTLVGTTAPALHRPLGGERGWRSSGGRAAEGKGGRGDAGAGGWFSCFPQESRVPLRAPAGLSRRKAAALRAPNPRCSGRSATLLAVLSLVNVCIMLWMTAEREGSQKPKRKAFGNVPEGEVGSDFLELSQPGNFLFERAFHSSTPQSPTWAHAGVKPRSALPRHQLPFAPTAAPAPSPPGIRRALGHSPALQRAGTWGSSLPPSATPGTVLQADAGPSLEDGLQMLRFSRLGHAKGSCCWHS